MSRLLFSFIPPYIIHSHSPVSNSNCFFKATFCCTNLHKALYCLIETLVKCLLVLFSQKWWHYKKKRNSTKTCHLFLFFVLFPPFHQILVHLGLLTKESGFKIAENAFSGGPLGELVQWSDLITTLYLLGHDVRISASLAELKESVPNTL